MMSLIGVVSDAERHDQMQTAINLRLPFLEKLGKFHDGKIAIVCYGPSLLDTWQQIPKGLPILSVSGAHDFLVSRDLIPTFHVEIDPRAHKPKMLKHPQFMTRYLMASVCHPDFWDVLQGFDVNLWHLINGPETVNWIANHHPAGMNCMIGGGVTVGQRALNVSAALGYRRFHIFGMDCSFGDERHAGPHTNETQPVMQVEHAGRLFRTTPGLWQAAQEMADFLLTVDAEVEFYGDGLLQEVAHTLRRTK
jgi:Protein of unknown function DUF115.